MVIPGFISGQVMWDFGGQSGTGVGSLFLANSHSNNHFTFMNYPTIQHFIKASLHITERKWYSSLWGTKKMCHANVMPVL